MPLEKKKLPSYIELAQREAALNHILDLKKPKEKPKKGRLSSLFNIKYLDTYKLIPLGLGVANEIAETSAEIATGEGLGEFITLADHVSETEVSNAHHVLQYLGLFSNLINLGRLLSVFLGAKELGRELPWNFTKTAKTIYYITATVLSTLVIVFSVLNPPVAAFLVVAGAALALGHSTAILLKTIKHRYFSPEHKYALEKAELASLRAQKADLLTLEKTIVQRGTVTEEEREAIKNSKYNATRHKELEIKRERKNERLIHKAASVPLGILGLVGMVIALSNPIGLGIAGLGGALGVSMLFLMPIGQRAYHYISSKKSAAKRAVREEKNGLEVKEAPKFDMSSISTGHINTLNVCPITGKKEPQEVSPRASASLDASMRPKPPAVKVEDEEDTDTDTDTESDRDREGQSFSNH